MNLMSRVIVVAALLLGGCRAGEQDRNAVAAAEAQIAPILATADARDTASYARPLEARVHHVALDLHDTAAKLAPGPAEVQGPDGAAVQRFHLRRHPGPALLYRMRAAVGPGR